MSVLVDTNILIDFLRGMPVAATFVGGLPPKPAISVITLAELIAGARQQRDERTAERLFGEFVVLPVTAEIARRAGAWKRLFEPSHGVGLADAIIAATAEHHELPLATLNVRRFPMFPRLKPAY